MNEIEREIYDENLSEITNVMTERWKLFNHPIVDHKTKMFDFKRTIEDAFLRGFYAGKQASKTTETNNETNGKH